MKSKCCKEEVRETGMVNNVGEPIYFCLECGDHCEVVDSEVCDTKGQNCHTNDTDVTQVTYKDEEWVGKFKSSFVNEFNDFYSWTADDGEDVSCVDDVIDFIRQVCKEAYNDGVFDAVMQRGFHAKFIDEEMRQLSIKQDIEFKKQAQVEILKKVLELPNPTYTDWVVIDREQVKNLISELRN